MAKHLTALVVAALASISTGNSSRAAPPPPLPAEQVKDAADVEDIFHKIAKLGVLSIADDEGKLRAILAHAPANYPLVEMKPEYAVVRDESLSQADVLQLLIKAALDKRPFSVVRQPNTYGDARLALASYAVETRRPEVAIQELDAGLAMQPDNPSFISEKAAALEMLHRPADALATIDAWLPNQKFVSGKRRAILLRARGYALVELGRLEEAEAAYKESLVLQPGHGGAETELRYIASVKRGAPLNAPVQFLTSDKAEKYKGEPTPSSGPPSPR